ncbi:hypothetical protein ACFQDN_21565 [Pseudomonas asuensis]|uniref:Lipoprotein n=1 Tax=Pseudomonas asuensis TaxID=1825787 RepID=A0ABQ2H344_9PSED|nr:hypothetical protein [Pseudomonas asuensis]GGM26169.1 hypothetical protein GCM10009425_41110 [Pseudomonas asuensis]
MKRNTTVLAMTVALAIVGCDDQDRVVASQQQNTKASQASPPSSLLSSPKPKLSHTPQTTQNEVTAIPNANVSVSSYTDLNQEPNGMGLTYLITSRSLEPISEDELLNRLSPIYYNESDVFKKRELARSELPKIDAVIRKYKLQQYFQIPISTYAEQPLTLTNISLGAYDFGTKSFPIISYGKNCWGGVIRNQQGATMRIIGSDLPCSLQVEDEDQAKMIESARSENALQLTGKLYIFVPEAKEGTALAVPTHVQIHLSNAQTNAPLASLKL